MWDRPELPVDVSVGDVDAWPALATALASLSGWLEEAQAESDLREALAHGCALVSGRVVRLKAVRREVAAVIEAVLLWGDRQRAEGPGKGA